MTRRAALPASLLAVALLTAGCAGPASGPAVGTPSIPTTSATIPPTTLAPLASSPAAPTDPPAAPAGFDARAVLEPLVVDDRPQPDRPYRRDDWPHWDDIDGNGCDGREDALLTATLEPAELGPACKVLSGEWMSPYDGLTTSDPAGIQIDHLVPLQNAFTSGGWRWETPRRRLFANDPSELVAVSAASNQSKGSKTPDQWRPPVRDVWCSYAVAWVRVKVTYDLTVTTSERDALGQMLDTCPADTPRDARPGGPGDTPTGPVARPSPAPAPASPPPPAETSGDGPYFANCAAARAAGAAPIRRGEPGYRDRLDGDGDGVACE